jgi:hypothetical protein
LGYIKIKRVRLFEVKINESNPVDTSANSNIIKNLKKK